MRKFAAGYEYCKKKTQVLMKTLLFFQKAQKANKKQFLKAAKQVLEKMKKSSCF